MRVTIKIIGGLIHQVGFSEREMDIPDGLSLKELLASIRVDEGSPRIVTRNGQYITPEEKLADGDRIVVCHLYSGG